MPMFIGEIEALRGGTFDVVTMNIIPEVIIPLLPQVITHVQERLILSGILIVRKEDAIAAARDLGFTVTRERERGEWWAGELRRTAVNGAEGSASGHGPSMQVAFEC